MLLKILMLLILIMILLMLLMLLMLITVIESYSELEVHALESGGSLDAPHTIGLCDLHHLL